MLYIDGDLPALHEREAGVVDVAVEKFGDDAVDQADTEFFVLFLGEEMAVVQLEDNNHLDSDGQQNHRHDE